MYKFLLFVFAASLSGGCITNATKNSTSDPKDDYLIAQRSFPEEVINQLKGTTTVFFHNKINEAQNDSIEAAIKSSWSLTPIIFDDFENFGKYATDPKFSYFVIEGNTTIHSSSTGTYRSTHYYLTLRLFKDLGKKGVINTYGFCRIELFPNFRTMNIGAGSQVISSLYRNGMFYNWTPVLLKAQLSAVENNIKSKTRPWLFQNVTDEKLAKILSRDTLYVPKSILKSFNKFNGKESDEKEQVISGYPYKYKVCTDSELFRIFETEKRGRLLFEYVKSSTDKFVTIYDLKDKKIIYKKYTALSYNLKGKDLEKMD